MSLWKALGFREMGAQPLLRCSFCNKSQRNVRMLIAGPKVYVCDDCVDVCREIIAENEKKLPPPDPSTLRCSLCKSWVPSSSVLGLGTRGNLCQTCSQAVEDALTVTPRGGKS